MCIAVHDWHVCLFVMLQKTASKNAKRTGRCSTWHATRQSGSLEFDRRGCWSPNCSANEHIHAICTLILISIINEALFLIIDYCENIGARRVRDTANVMLELHAISYHVYTIHEWAYMRRTMCVCFMQIMFHAFARIKYWSLMNNLFLLFINLILVLINILFERPILSRFLLIFLLFLECNIICLYFIPVK